MSNDNTIITLPVPFKNAKEKGLLRMQYPFSDGLWGIVESYSVKEERLTSMLTSFHKNNDIYLDIEIALAGLAVLTQRSPKYFNKSSCNFMFLLMCTMQCLDKAYGQEMAEMAEQSESSGPNSSHQSHGLSVTIDGLFGKDRFFMFDRVRYMKLSSGLLYQSRPVSAKSDAGSKSKEMGVSMLAEYGKENRKHIASSGCADGPPIFQVMFDYITVTRRILVLKDMMGNEQKTSKVDASRSQETGLADDDSFGLKKWLVAEYTRIVHTKEVEKRSELFSILQAQARLDQHKSWNELRANVREGNIEKEVISRSDGAIITPSTSAQDISTSTDNCKPIMIDVGTQTEAGPPEMLPAYPIKIQLAVMDVMPRMFDDRLSELGEELRMLRRGLDLEQINREDVLRIVQSNDRKSAETLGLLNLTKPTVFVQLQNQVQAGTAQNHDDVTKLGEQIKENHQENQAQLQMIADTTRDFSKIIKFCKTAPAKLWRILVDASYKIWTEPSS